MTMITSVTHDLIQQIPQIPQYGRQGLDFMRQENPLSSLYHGLYMVGALGVFMTRNPKADPKDFLLHTF